MLGDCTPTQRLSDSQSRIPYLIAESGLITGFGLGDVAGGRLQKLTEISIAIKFKEGLSL